MLRKSMNATDNSLAMGLFAALWLMSWLPSAGAAESLARPVYSFGVTPQFDSRTIHSIWRPILTELEMRTGLRFQLVGSPTIPAFERQIQAGELDFAYANPYQVMVATHNYVPLVRDGKQNLSGILVVRKDSLIQGVSGLQGKVVAFPSPNALGASLMPRAHLHSAGVVIQPRYVQTHSSVYLNVALGQVDAGGGVNKTLDEQPANVRDSLRIIYRTPEVAALPVVAHSRISGAARDHVRAVLLELGTTAEGRALLGKIPIHEATPAAASDYEPLRRMGLEKFYVPN